MILQLYFYKHTMNIIYVIVEIKYLMEIEILICLINFQICLVPIEFRNEEFCMVKDVLVHWKNFN